MGSNLLYKASIVTTPTAYGVGVLNSIKPAFSLGAEEITNGNFSVSGTINATSYSLGFASSDTGGTFTISNGQVTLARVNGSTRLRGTNGVDSLNFLTSGKKYRLVYNVISNNGVSAFFYFNGSTNVAAPSSVGQHTIDYTSAGTQFYFETQNNGSNITLDSISIKARTDADFDFTRTSSATRVNPDYLIETVSINSANLVKNGNFSELGTEEVTNGGFETDTDWTKGAGITISGGSANFTGVPNANINQSASVFNGITYKITFTISNYVSGNIDYNIGGATRRGSASANGTYTDYVVSNTGQVFFFQSDQTLGFTGSIENVSIKQVDPNDNWSLGTGWSLGDGVAIHTGSTGNLGTNASLSINKKYKVQFEILTIADGVCNIYDTSTATTYASFNSIGVKSQIIIKDSNGLLAFRSSSTNIKITNVSIIEIQENGVPRLDYTNGTASILLEPQSTNLITYSEDFSQWAKTGTTSVSSNDNISPDGTLNASTVSGLTGSGSNDLGLNTGLNTSNKTYTFSVYLKGSGTLRLHLSNNIDNAASNVVTLTTSWVRYELTHTFNSTTSTSISSVLDDSGGTATKYNVWGAMLEEQSFATSYIPTLGQSGGVTRAAETLNNAGSSDLINSTEGVLYAEIAALANDGTNRTITLSDGTYTNSVRIQLYLTTNTIEMRVVVGGVIQAIQRPVISNALQFNKIAIKYKENDFSFWINGVEVATDTSGIVFPSGTLSKLAFDQGDGSVDFFGKTKCVAVFKEALTDTELACLTSTNNREIFLNYYYRMQYVGANTEALSCAEQTFNV